MILQKVHLIIHLALIVQISAQIFCSDLLQHNQTKYFPLRHCQRSNKTVIGMKNVQNLRKCAEFADNNRALAFNYGHGKKPYKKSVQNNLINLFDLANRKNQSNLNTTISHTEDDFEEYFNCEILSCPEVGNLTSLINDTRYDYYSAYAKPIRKFCCFFFE